MRGNPPSLRRSTSRRAARNRAGGLALAESMEPRRLLAVAVLDLGVAVPDDATTAVVGTTLYFPGRTDAEGVELWRSDGTVAGTRLVKDLVPGPSSVGVGQLTAVGNTLYFVGPSSVPGTFAGLWRSDGTEAGTVQLKGLMSATELTAVGDRLFFVGTPDDDEPGTAAGLWVSDGTAAGTRLVRALGPTGAGSIAGITDFNGLAFFRGGEALGAPGTGAEPWVSDGTAAGTRLLKDINAGAAGSRGIAQPEFDRGTVAGGRLYFGADDGAHGYELWSTDGTEAGTRLVSDLLPGAAGSNVQPAVVARAPDAGALYSFAEDGAGGLNLFRTDGPTGQTTLLKRVSDAHPGGPVPAAALDDSTGRIVFAATNAASGNELWVSTGTEPGTWMMSDANPGPAQSIHGRSPFVTVDLRTYYVATEGSSGFELWSTKYTFAGGERVADLAAGETGSTPEHLTAAGDKLFFTAYADGRVASDVPTLMVASATEPSPGSISGVVVNDVDRDGYASPWEAPLGGWKVYVNYSGFGSRSPHHAYAVTAPDGTFTIDNVRPGTWVLATEPPDGWEWLTVPTTARTVTIVPGGEVAGVAFPVPLRYGDIVVHAFEDLDFDGVRDAGEPGLAGARFFSDADHEGNPGASEAAVVTGADGRAVFEDAVIGDHRITRVMSDGWTATTPSVDYVDVRVVEGQTKEAFFGFARGGAAGSISGTVYNDLDYDRARDPGEPGLASRAVFIDQDGDKAWDTGEATVGTDAAGRYTFSGLAPGTYYLMLRSMFGWMQTSPVEGSHSPRYVVVTLAGGQGAAGRDFGTTQASPGRISGTLYVDTNFNGRRDTGEQPPGQTGLFLDADDDGQFDNNEYLTISGPNGSYQFNNILPGTYNVRQDLRGRDQTEPGPGSEAGHVVTLSPAGQSITNLNFGSLSPGMMARISGFVFDDVNGDGFRGAGEPALSPGAVVYLDADNDAVLDAAERRMTAGSDGYWFDSLAAGTYTLRVVPPAGTRQTFPAGNAAHVVTVTLGQRPVRDFGITSGGTGSGAIGGSVYFDNDGNGTRSAGDSGARDITVYLDADNDNRLDPGERSTRTDPVGQYAFAGLAPGQYVVRQLIDSDLTAQTQPAGRDALDRPVGHAVTVVGGQVSANNDFGRANTAVLGRAYGAVFDDANGNGVRDAGEAAPAGRVVYLDADNDRVLDDGERRFTQGAPGVIGYVFLDLLPGTYTVRAVVPPGSTQSVPAGGAGHTFTVAQRQVVGPLAFGLAPSPEPVTRPAAADAYVRDGSSAGNRYGAAAELQVKRSSSADLQREAYLRFDLGGLGAIATATLRLFGALQSASGESIAIAAYPSADVAWPENDVTWNTKPATGATALASATVTGTTDQWYEWDVTEYLRQQRAAGATSVTFALKGVANSSAYVRFASDEAANAATRPQLLVEPGAVDVTRPTVLGMTVGGSGWAPDFVSALGRMGFGAGGYALPAAGDAGAARTLPWETLDTVTVRFSEHVLVQADDLRVGGVLAAAYASRDFRYDPATFTATWTLVQPLGRDRVTFELDGRLPGGIADAAGNLLGGGPGGTPGDVVVNAGVLPGDANGDGVVNANDLADVKRRLTRTAANAGPGPITLTGYSPFADLDADGRTNAIDVAAVKRHLTRRLPDAPASAVPAPGPFSSQPVASDVPSDLLRDAGSGNVLGSWG